MLTNYFMPKTALYRTMALLWGIFLVNSLSGQEFFRFKADFSIKEKENTQAQGTLITGQVYYDKNLNKIAYSIRFPEPEQWLLQDTFLYRIVADTLASRRGIAPLGEYSFFNLILNQQLGDFGLGKVGFTPGEVRQEGKQVLSTWNPPAQMAAHAGSVVLAQENKVLTGAAFQSKDGKVLGKFYFQDYRNIDGLPVPGKIYQVYYREKSEFVRLLTFTNVVINQADETNMYDFSIPAGR